MPLLPPKLAALFGKVLHLLPLALFCAALLVVHYQIKIHPFSEISAAVHTFPLRIIGIAVALTLANYFVLTGYDALALRYTGNRIPFPKVMIASLIGYAISNNTGHSWAAGGSIRYRFYTSWGVPGWDVVRISLFLALTYILGVLTLGFAGTLLMPADLRGQIENPQMVPWLMAACGAGLAFYWAAVFLWRKPVKIRDMAISLPSPGMTAAQTIVSAIDLLMASLVLWTFLPGHVEMTFQTFIVIYVTAQVAGLLSQVPGGIGVFEGAFLWLASGNVPEEQHLALVGALILYRVVYYFMPLLLAGAGLLGFEIHERRKALAQGGKVVITAISGAVPQLLSVLLFATGCVLLVSDATPSVPRHMHWLHDMLPLSVVEASHLVGSLTGLLLLFLARGIILRIDAAWYGAVALLTLGVAVSILKGFDWREASVLGAILLLFLPCKPYFRRRSSLLSMPFSANWMIMIVIALIISAWIGFFAYRHIEYMHELWWRFSFKDDAPRFLRALFVVSLTLAAFMLYRMLGIARPRNLELPTAAELDEATKIASAGRDTNGFLALTRDKKLFWSTDRLAFLMFADTPHYWIVMGDPVGKAESFPELLWRFREETDRHGARAVLYEVGDNHLPLYIDLGMTILKIGEYARVRLENFGLEGGRRENMRKNHNRFKKNGFTFRILSPDEVVQALPRLREISDTWMARKNAREKGFSLGFFDEDYIRRTPVAIICDTEGRIMAFANLWSLDSRQETCIDLMRYDPDSPSGIMEHLFVELILWAKGEGFVYFGLGMAPLAGLERHPLAPLWHKIGTAVFDHGDDLYNFEGLYAYKSKFDPEWQARYLAVPTGLKAPSVLLQIAALIARGWGGIVSR